MYDETTIGARLRVLRRWRGKTLTQLAGETGLSISFLSMAERGQRALDRRSHIAELARALQVSETDLVGGPHLSSDPVQSAPHTYIPPLRVALESNGITLGPVVEHARPINELVELMNGNIDYHRRRYDYIEVGKYLPDVIDELNVHVHAPADGAVHELALRTLIEAYMCASGMARSLGHADLGHIASMRAHDAAVALDDPIAKGMAAFSLLRPNAANWDRITTMAGRAASELQPHVTDGRGVEVLGMLTLNAALAAAACRKAGTANDWLGEAAELAARVPDDLGGNWQAFSDTNVKIWQITIGVELGALGGEIATLADHVDEAKLDANPARKACFMADVGRGLARDPKRRADAVRWFGRAEAVAPQRIRNDPKVRESVSVMLERAKASAGGRELRGMAARMGVPH
jgi:transcriptional regulator with XRE-family HTH domain